MIIFKQVQKDGVPVTQAKDLDTKSLNLHADVVIVGSGAGGSVVAYEMAKAGRSVIVLEAGRYVPSASFKEDMMDSLKRIYQDVGVQTNTTGDLVLLQGACIGGSSVVNATICSRAPDEVLNHWVKDLGLTDLTPETLAPYYTKIEQRLHVHVNEQHEINACASKVVEGCKEMGWSWKPLSRNVKQCALTGHCLAGCPSDRKQSMLVTYLPWAAAEGGDHFRMFSDTYVDQILTRNGRAAAVEGRIIDPDTKQVVAEIHVDAQVIILAAGAVQSPMLLQKSGLEGHSGLVGRNLSVNPTVTVLAKFPEPVYGWRGALTGVRVDEFDTPHVGGYTMETTLASPVQLLYQGEQGTGTDHLRFMEEYKYFAAMVVTVHDNGNGFVHWDGPIRGGDKKLEWNLSREYFETFQKAIKDAARVFFAAGAEKVYLPTFQRLVSTSVFNLDKTVDAIDFGAVGLYSLRMFGYHPQGTCKMGTDPHTSVVNAVGESHTVGGLFVVDASIFPTDINVNPQMTVYAMANYISDHILKRATSYFWT
jgi:choline dehydrogenase-like flavoprotein